MHNRISINFIFLDLHRQDADLVTVAIAEKTTKVAQILVVHMEQMRRRKIRLAVVVVDFAHVSFGQMMMKISDLEIVSLCMKMITAVSAQNQNV